MYGEKLFKKVISHIRKHSLLYFLIFIFIIYNANGRVIHAADNKGHYLLALSLAGDGDMYVNEYSDYYMQDKSHLREEGGVITPYYLFTLKEQVLVSNNIMSGLLAFPTFKLISLFTDLSPDKWFIPFIAKLVSSILMVFSALFIFLSAKVFVSKKNSFLLASIFAFGTSIWSVLSQDLWNHSPVIFFVALSIYILARSENDPSMIKYLGFSLAGAFVSKIIMVSLLFFLSFYVAIYYKNQITNFLLCSLPFVFIYILDNLFTYYSDKSFLFMFFILILCILIFFFMGFLFMKIFASLKRKISFIVFFFLLFFSFSFIIMFNFIPIEWTLLFGSGYFYLAYFSRFGGLNIHNLLALLFSPSRGLLFFSPVLIFSFSALFFFKNKLSRINVLQLLLFSSFLLSLIILSNYVQWFGGWSFGYRLLLEQIPILVFLLIPFIKFMSKKKFWTYLFIILLFFSIFVQLIGFTSYDYSWNVSEDISACNAQSCSVKFWSLKSSQLFYYVLNPKLHFFESKTRGYITST